MKKILITIIYIFLVSCQKESDSKQVDFSPAMQARLDESKKTILSHRKDEYSLENGSESPEEAIRKFLIKSSIEPNLKNNSFFFTKKEHEEVMYPNVYGYGTSLDVTPLDDYYILFSKRADIGYDKLRNKLNKNLSLQKLEIVFAKPRIYGKLEGFKPRIIIKNKQGSFDIEEIKMVFKVGNLYKVGVVAP